jgi:predicted RNA-binding protein Jag
LVRIQDVEAVLQRVRSGGSLRTRREFRASSVESAVRQACARLGVSPEELPYEVQEYGSPRIVGMRAKQARIVVDLTQIATPAPKPSPRATSKHDGEAPTVELEKPQQAEPKQAEPQQIEPKQAEPKKIESEQVSSEPEAAEEESNASADYYYAPEQAARILGKTLHELNLWIYQGKLPIENINDYRWLPREAVEEKVKEISAPELENPPEPFLILKPEEHEASRIGPHELRQDSVLFADSHERIAELEEQVEALRRELRFEKARRAQEESEEHKENRSEAL